MSKTLGESLGRSRGHLRITLILAGIVTMLATLALGAATIRPTEAAWQDTSHGGSVFGMAKQNVNSHFARSISGFGSIMSGTENSRPFGPDLREALPEAEWISRADRPADWARADSGVFASVRAAADTRTCARRENRVGTNCGPLPEKSAATSYAVSQLRNLEAKATPLFRSIPLVSSGSTPTIATASCSPGQAGQATLSGKSLTLGDPDSDDARPIPIPRAGKSQTLTPQRSGLYTYSAAIEHVSGQQPGYALSELRLRVEVTSVFAEKWSFNTILAHAECGLSRPATDRPAQPQAGSSTVVNQQRTADADAPAASQPIVQVEATDDAGVPDSPSASVATSTATQSTTRPPAGDGSEGVGAQTSVSDTRAPETETTNAESARPSQPTEVSPQPQNVAVDRRFSLTGRDGVELGTAKVSDIVRIPGCGVALTLSITTSAEAGPDRWASIGPADFAEVRSGGTLREARRLGSDCAQSVHSRTTALSPSRDHQIVLSFLLGDTAQRAMLRPAGTAGWIIDLPPQTPVPAPTSTVPTSSVPTSSVPVPASSVPASTVPASPVLASPAAASPARSGTALASH